MDILTNIFGFILGLGILVFIHELGHFLMARLCGVRVEQFSIGFPPRIWSKKIGDTEYCISALPIGGYVKMAGMLDENMDASVTGAPDEFMSKNTFQKSLILLGGVLFNFITAVLIFFYFNVSLGENKIVYNQVQTVPHHSPLKPFIPEDDITLLSIRGEEIETVSSFFNILFSHLGEEIPFSYRRSDGSVVQKTLPEDLPINKFLVFHEYAALAGKIHVTGVAKQSLAESIGIQKGDTLLLINNYPIRSVNGLKGILNKHNHDSVSIVVKRGEEEKLFRTYLASEHEDGVILGVGAYSHLLTEEWIKTHTQSRTFLPGEALKKAFYDSSDTLLKIYKGLASIFKGNADARENLGGPIAIAKMFGDSMGSVYQFIHLVAMFSIMLAFMNILPIPGLDGGHLLIVLIEGIRGRELALETKLTIQKIGFLFLVSIMIFAITNDISKIF